MPGLLQAFLGLALLVEGLLFGFHLKGTELDWKLHLLLVVVILLAAGVCVAEISHPHSLMLSTARAQLVLLQGIWFYQIAQILFKGAFPLPVLGPVKTAGCSRAACICSREPTVPHFVMVSTAGLFASKSDKQFSLVWFG